ncbi:MAG: hypothetical protein QG573_1997 [Acidobacteriota bacterium]|nr:hypothetical protein [Acidobacteriota bacterium]
MMKAAARTAPCHGAQASGGMAAPMDCCQPVATPAPSSALPGLETPAAALAAALPGAVVIAARALPVAYSRAGELHPLGLFTLHSVWRI